MWGERWGEMVWGMPAAMAATTPVPLGAWAIVVLGFALGVFAVLANRSRLPRAAPLLVLLAVPMVTMAVVTLPHTFENGTVANADEVNDNFALLAAESNAQDARLTALEGAHSVSLVAAQGLASPGGTSFAQIVAAVNDSSGPVTGLGSSAFFLSTEIVPPGGSSLRIRSVSAGAAGVYRLRVEPVVNTWLSGRYLLSVAVRVSSEVTVQVVGLDIAS